MGDYIYIMLVVDFVILNRDRHGANIEVLRNSRDKTLRLAPLFDHGLSLLFNCTNICCPADFKGRCPKAPAGLFKCAGVRKEYDSCAVRTPRGEYEAKVASYSIQSLIFFES